MNAQESSNGILRRFLNGMHYKYVHLKPFQRVRAVFLLILFVDILLQPWLAGFGFAPDHIGSFRDLPQKIWLRASITGEPDVRSDGQNLTMNVQGVMIQNGNENLGAVFRPVYGKVLVKADRYPEYAYGEVLDVRCTLQTPPTFEKFSYAALLAKDDIFALCTQPLIRRVIQVDSGNFFKDLSTFFWSGIFRFKSFMLGRVNSLFVEPHASLVAGILLGVRRSIPQKILDDFNTAGLTHVLAVSGYNVSMMISVFGYFGQKAARRWRYAGMFAGVLGLVALTGFSASVLRAAWMGCISLVAQVFGRKGSAVHLLLLSAVIMVFLSPRMILVDLSFQLSFLSTLGILLFMPKIEMLEAQLIENPKFSWIQKIPSFMREGFCVTMAAQVFTTPLLFYQFGRFSLIAPFANIFVLPLVPWIMFFGFCALVVSFIFYPFGQLLSFLAYVLITFMLLLVNFFASIPFASLQFK